jgi:hypothetical protein
MTTNVRIRGTGAATKKASSAYHGVNLSQSLAGLWYAAAWQRVQCGIAPPHGLEGVFAAKYNRCYYAIRRSTASDSIAAPMCEASFDAEAMCQSEWITHAGVPATVTIASICPSSLPPSQLFDDSRAFDRPRSQVQEQGHTPTILPLERPLFSDCPVPHLSSFCSRADVTWHSHHHTGIVRSLHSVYGTVCAQN